MNQHLFGMMSVFLGSLAVLCYSEKTVYEFFGQILHFTVASGYLGYCMYRLAVDQEI